jgi:hypothetical protein
VVAPADAADEELELIFDGDGHLECSFDSRKRQMVLLCWSKMKSGKAVGVDRLRKICQDEVVR